MSTKKYSKSSKKNSSKKKAPVVKEQLTFKEKLIRTVKSKMFGKMCIVFAIVLALLSISIILCVKIPVWSLHKADKAYLEAMEAGIAATKTPEVILPNAEINTLTDAQIREVLFSSQLLDASTFDDELVNNEVYSQYAEYTHATIPLADLMTIMTSTVAIDLHTDVISLTDYIKANIGTYDLTIDAMIELVNRYYYNVFIIENMLDAQSFVESRYNAIIDTYNTIPADEHTTGVSPLELRSVYTDFVVSPATLGELTTISDKLHCILEVYYWETLEDYQSTPFGSSDLSKLNLSYFSPDANNLYDLLFHYYLAATDYDISGTEYGLYLEDESLSTTIQETGNVLADKLGYCALYYGMLEDTDNTFNFFEKIGSDVAKRFMTEGDRRELLRFVYSHIAGYTTLGDPISEQTRADYTGDYVFWNILFETINTNSDGLSPDNGIYVCTQNYMNDSSVQMIVWPNNMMFNGGTTEDTVKNLCWSKGITDFYSNVTLASGITVNETTGASEIPNDLTEEQNSALNLIYAWVNYATRYVDN